MGLIYWILRHSPGYRQGLKDAHDLVLEHWYEWEKAQLMPSRSELAYIARRILNL